MLDVHLVDHAEWLGNFNLSFVKLWDTDCAELWHFFSDKLCLLDVVRHVSEDCPGYWDAGRVLLLYWDFDVDWHFHWNLNRDVDGHALLDKLWHSLDDFVRNEFLFVAWSWHWVGEVKWLIDSHDLLPDASAWRRWCDCTSAPSL